VATLEDLFKSLLGDDLKFRIRGSHFPFTEPSIELDLKKPGGKWLEMLGAGMVNPRVIEYYGLDPEKYQGYAFGVGLERILNIKCDVDDIRYNLNDDYRYLGQF
jgi:phenylalanyl-tRNA synthetase alpha chain